jgi:regulator of nucleoside diphosphate kinase
MYASNIGERTLTELDFVRLKRVAASAAAPQLEEILRDAEVVSSSAVPPDVVTMYAKIIVQDLRLRQRRILVVCYPGDAEAETGQISVLSPAGSALLGLSVGAAATWAGPGGETSVVQIEEVLFQPEAVGDYVT